jgi:hypothetical protein
MLYVAVPSTTADLQARVSRTVAALKDKAFHPVRRAVLHTMGALSLTWTGISRAPPPKGFFEHSQISARPVAARVSQCDERSLRRVLPASTADVGGRRPDVVVVGSGSRLKHFLQRVAICSFTFLGALKPVFVLALPLLFGVSFNYLYFDDPAPRAPHGVNAFARQPRCRPKPSPSRSTGIA